MTIRRAGQGDIDAIIVLQKAAYAQNRLLLGVEPLPLQVDYPIILASREAWLAERRGRLDGVLILERRADHLLIWSIAVEPASQGQGVGGSLLAHADARARAKGLRTVRLYTGEPLTGNIAWYERHGFVRDRIEQLDDRRIVHMVKPLG